MNKEGSIAEQDCMMRSYYLSPHVYIEHFDDAAILFQAECDLMFTINLAGAELFESARAMLSKTSFNRLECLEFLLDNYTLTPEEAERQLRSLLTFGLRNRIVIQGAPQ